MADVRRNIDCDYCGGKVHIKYSDELIATYCCFCGEPFDDPLAADEEDDGDLDYSDDERDELRGIL